MDSFEMKVLVPAGMLPDGALVTKKTGTAKFRVRRQMRFYVSGGADESQRQTVVPKDGCVILVSADEEGRDAVNIYPATTEFLWHVDSEELERWLQEQHEPTSK